MPTGSINPSVLTYRKPLPTLSDIGFSDTANAILMADRLMAGRLGVLRGNVLDNHENLTREDGVKVGSERAFGITFAVIFALITIYQLLKALPTWWWFLALAAAFLAAGLLFPRILRPLNLIWFRFGLLLHRIVNPIIMGLLFFGAVMPIGLLMRVLGKRPLALKRASDTPSYWIPRNPPGPTPPSFKDQF